MGKVSINLVELKDKMYEVEIRGILNKKQFLELKEFLDNFGNFERIFEMLSIEISPGFNPETRKWQQSGINFRLKRSGDSERITLKYGDLMSDTVEEHEVLLASNQLIPALKLFSRLGFDKGLIMFWTRWLYGYRGFEVNLNKYTEDYYMWEIDAKDKFGSEEEARKGVYELAEDLHLKPLSAEEFRVAADYQNQNIFELYSIERVRELVKKEFDS